MDVNPLSSSSQVLGSEYQEKAALRAANVKGTDHHTTVDAKDLGRATSSNGGARETEISCSEQSGHHGDGAPAEPSKEEAKAKEKAELKAGWGAYMKLWTYATPLDHALRFCGFLAACTAGAVLPLMTLVFGRLVNDFNGWARGETSPERLRAAINANTLWFVWLFIVKFGTVYIHTTAFTITAIRATKAIRMRYIHAILSQDIAYFETRTPGSVATSISNNVNLIQGGLAEKIGVIFQGLAMLVASFVVAFSQYWKLTLVGAAPFPATVIAVGVTVAMDARVEAKILDIYSKAGGIAEEALSSVRTVTAFGAVEKLRKKYDGYLETAKGLGMKKGPLLGIQYSTGFFMMYCVYSLTFWYGIRLLVKGQISDGGKVVTVLFSIVIGASSLSAISPALGDVTKAAAAAKDVLDTIALKPKIDPDTQGYEPESVVGHVSFRSVSFAYPQRPTIKVLDEINLDFEAGKVTAIVGASGSGKSTIVSLTERFYDPASGSIMLDGRDIKGLNRKWVRSQIGLVQQEPFLFNDTIYNNVLHGLCGTEMDDLPDEQKRSLVEEACIYANADTFIRKLPNGYDTKIGERGSVLSGGQKQRVAIARSIISDPRILLLDEATSALDPVAESSVQAALDKVTRKRTTIVIAHKLATVMKANKIIVISSGKVVGEGTHQTLLAADGAYARLVRAQNLHLTADGKVKTGFNGVEEKTLASEEPDRLASADVIAVGNKQYKTKDDFRKISIVGCVAAVLKEMRAAWLYFFCGISAAVLGGGVFPASAFLFSRILTVFKYDGAKLESVGNFWALMFFILALGVLLAYATLGFFFTVGAIITSKFYRSEYFGAMLRQDIGYFDLEGNTSGALTSRLSTDSQALQDLLSTNLGLFIIVVVNIVGCWILAFVLGWKLTLVAIFGCLPPVFFAGFVRMRLEMQSQDKTAARYEESARFASEAVGAIRTVASLNLEAKVLRLYGSSLGATVKSFYKHVTLVMILFGLSESLDLLAMALAFWYGGRLLSERYYSAEDFFAIFDAIVFGGQSAGFLFGFTLSSTKGQAGTNRILHLRSQTPPINSSTGAPIPAVHAPEPVIEFRNVCFSYPTAPSIPVLRSLSLAIHAGQNVGIVGASGCGKSTIISLLERFYDTTSGDILINGRPIREVDVSTYRSTLGLVSQETTLYQGTMRDNILFGMPSSVAVEDEIITRACKDANIHDFILSLPQGYDTEAGSHGLSLSGGQRQRLAIARALVRNPSILLLDEATSALDSHSEAVVQEALATAAKGRTTIAVAHRLATIKGADCIFVIDGGRVVESGKHEELLAQRGWYSRMCEAQGLDMDASGGQ